MIMSFAQIKPFLFGKGVLFYGGSSFGVLVAYPSFMVLKPSSILFLYCISVCFSVTIFILKRLPCALVTLPDVFSIVGANLYYFTTN